LVQGLVRASRAHDILVWCAAMEKALLRLLRSHGIHFHSVGDPIDYHGFRYPVAEKVEPILARMREERPAAWNVVIGAKQ